MQPVFATLTAFSMLIHSVFGCPCVADEHHHGGEEMLSYHCDDAESADIDRHHSDDGCHQSDHADHADTNLSEHVPAGLSDEHCSDSHEAHCFHGCDCSSLRGQGPELPLALAVIALLESATPECAALPRAVANRPQTAPPAHDVRQHCALTQTWRL